MTCQYGAGRLWTTGTDVSFPGGGGGWGLALKEREQGYIQVRKLASQKVVN